MWVTRLKIKHDCVIGNRCEKFKVTTLGTPFNVFQEKGITHAPQVQTLHGKEENINEFIKDIKKDKRIKSLEIEGDTIFFIEVRNDKIPSTFYHQRLIHVKPVFVDIKGYEYWEIASWEKKFLIEFIEKVEREIKNIEILKIEQTKLNEIYFPRIMPKLTAHQKRAIELALENGFYEWPKKTNLIKLAKLMNVSIPTFREHLKRAEEKILPNLTRLIDE